MKKEELQKVVAEQSDIIRNLEAALMAICNDCEFIERNKNLQDVETLLKSNSSTIEFCKRKINGKQ